ncbi:MAG: hypothetical protein LC135_10545 [Phycisphaerae bacterium]|nr:hypothetical protein [Phycisphaerae bacterium]MCZ2400287.1 hypothetical protein [Phycisphaerae bacterium]NUQ49251.1 hypothetical protein [Phycisphaerae bacterium]
MNACVWVLLPALGMLLQTVRPDAAPGAAARRFEPPEPIAVVEDRSIREASGIVASRRWPGLLYVHNDSGDQPRVFVVDRSGRTRAVLHLKGAENVDWEDIAIAPGATGGVDVCVADIGDNAGRRTDLRLYRFAEPDELRRHVESPASAPAASRPPTVEITPRAYALRYEDGPRNAEAFFVHPATGHGYVLTKREDGQTEVYRLDAPWKTEGENVLRRIAIIRLPPGLPAANMVTAADIAAGGRHVAVRTYGGGIELSLPDGTGPEDFDSIFARPYSRLLLAAEEQGEGLCYSHDGRALLTIGEKRRPELYESRLAEPAGQEASAPAGSGE